MSFLLGLVLPMFIIMVPIVFLLEHLEDKKAEKRANSHEKDRYFELRLYGGASGVDTLKSKSSSFSGTFRTKD